MPGTRIKWPTVCRWYFRIQFLVWKIMHFIHISPKYVPKYPLNIDSYNSMMHIGRKAIIWTDGGLVFLYTYTLLCPDEFNWYTFLHSLSFQGKDSMTSRLVWRMLNQLTTIHFYLLILRFVPVVSSPALCPRLERWLWPVMEQEWWDAIWWCRSWAMTRENCWLFVKSPWRDVSWIT